MITELQKKMWEEHVARRARMSAKKKPEEPPEPTIAQQEKAAVEADVDPIGQYINRVTLVNIQNLVAKHYGITRNDILSNRRFAKIVFARQVAYWLAKNTTPMSYPQIGRRFGPRDHTTIMHGTNKIDMLMQQNENLRKEIEKLKEQITKQEEITESDRRTLIGR